MKYCLWSRLNKSYLEKADEIIVNYRDRDIIYDYFENYPDKNIILKLNNDDDTNIDWNQMDTMNKLSRGRFIVCLWRASDIELVRNLGIPFYVDYELYSYQEVYELKEKGACYIKVGGSLFFDLPKVSKYGIAIRINPCCISSLLEDNKKACCYPWIRPEDIELYENYISTIEFNETDIKRAEALYRVYAERHNWPGSLSYIIQNPAFSALNRLIGPEVAQSRLACQQECLRSGTCHICERAFKIASSIKELEEYAADISYKQLKEDLNF